MNVTRVVSTLASSRRAMQLYPPAHPAYAETFQALLDAVSDATAAGPLTLNLHKGRIYNENVVVPDEVTGHAAIAEAFESRNIESLTFAPGFSASDGVGLIEVLSLKPGPSLDIEHELAERGVRAVKVAFLLDENEDDREERDRQREADRALYHRLMAALRDLTGRMAAGGAPDIAQASTLVGSVLSRLMDDAPAIMGLATMRGADDRSMFHSLNVMIYSLVLGQRLGLADDQMVSLGMAALMHDIGKTAFDADDSAQAEPMRLMHPRVGAEILERLSLEDPVPMLVAYEHHMRVDGSGWPQPPADHELHSFSRIVAIADFFENLTNAPAGSDSVTPDRALAHVLQQSGTALDPVLARLFVDALGVFPVGCLVRLSDQTVGVVSRPGDDPMTPVVRVAFDMRGTELEEAEEVDLSAGDVRIVEVIEPEALAIEVADKL